MEYQKQYNKNHVAVSNALQTNGYALNEEWCQFLKENHFLVGLSLDGTEEIHNAHRHDKAGNGTYARIKHAADLMDQYQVDYNILTVVTADIAERSKRSTQNTGKMAGITSNTSPVWIPWRKATERLLTL